MKKYTVYGEEFFPKFSFPIKGKFKKKNLLKIDLSAKNTVLSRGETKSLQGLHEYIFGTIKDEKARGAYGGYSEKRNLYERSSVFSTNEESRSIHLGIDFWFPVGTAVCAPLPGRVHSFKDNNESGDYGPTIILEHVLGNDKFYSLYGHLSRDSIKDLQVGRMIIRGEVFAYLGGPEENVDWPPHLHFQLIYDLEGKEGDYPGVCFESEKKRFLKNCPDPIEFFGGFNAVIV
ncbi:MAG: murein DD-endopeptidase MepM/ murein hydrolase activator NlpD [Cryomorphaceae bacterium]|jgi:murein DD-endopeptidase MepM/ murein hydrolase activator NlpD